MDEFTLMALATQQLQRRHQEEKTNYVVMVLKFIASLLVVVPLEVLLCLIQCKGRNFSAANNYR